MDIIAFILIAGITSGWALYFYARKRPDLAIIIFSCGWFLAITTGWFIKISTAQ